MMNREYIGLENCKHGSLYRVNARNFSFGIYDEDNQGFIGIRTKFGTQFLDMEYHWDTGAPYGTVKPLEFLELNVFPERNIQHNFINNRDYYLKIYDWLFSKANEYDK